MQKPLPPIFRRTQLVCGHRPSIHQPSTDRRGFTLVELLVAMAIAGFIAAIALGLISQITAYNMRMTAANDLGGLGLEAVNRIRQALIESRHIFSATERERDYLQAIDFAPEWFPLKGTRLPIVDDLSLFAPTLAPDPRSADRVGNALFFVEQLPALEYAGAMIDQYRFVLFYLVRRPIDSVGRFSAYLDLARWRSVPYADTTQLLALDAKPRAEIVTRFRELGVSYAWEVLEPVGVAFSRLSDGRVAQPPEPHHHIRTADVQSFVPRLGAAQRIFGRAIYSISFNHRSDFPIGLPIPLYAQSSAEWPDFPSGFEITLRGPSKGRTVYYRLVMATDISGHLIGRAQDMLVTVKD